MPASKAGSSWCSNVGGSKLLALHLDWRTAPLPVSPPDSPVSQSLVSAEPGTLPASAAVAAAESASLHQDKQHSPPASTENPQTATYDSAQAGKGTAVESASVKDSSDSTAVPVSNATPTASMPETTASNPKSRPSKPKDAAIKLQSIATNSQPAADQAPEPVAKVLSSKSLQQVVELVATAGSVGTMTRAKARQLLLQQQQQEKQQCHSRGQGATSNAPNMQTAVKVSAADGLPKQTSSKPLKAIDPGKEPCVRGAGDETGGGDTAEDGLEEGEMTEDKLQEGETAEDEMKEGGYLSPTGLANLPFNTSGHGRAELTVHAAADVVEPPGIAPGMHAVLVNKLSRLHLKGDASPKSLPGAFHTGDEVVKRGTPKSDRGNPKRVQRTCLGSFHRKGQMKEKKTSRLLTASTAPNKRAAEILQQNKARLLKGVLLSAQNLLASMPTPVEHGKDPATLEAAIATSRLALTSPRHPDSHQQMSCKQARSSQNSRLGLQLRSDNPRLQPSSARLCLQPSSESPRDCKTQQSNSKAQPALRDQHKGSLFAPGEAEAHIVVEHPVHMPSKHSTLRLPSNPAPTGTLKQRAALVSYAHAIRLLDCPHTPLEDSTLQSASTPAAKCRSTPSQANMVECFVDKQAADGSCQALTPLKQQQQQQSHVAESCHVHEHDSVEMTATPACSCSATGFGLFPPLPLDTPPLLPTTTPPPPPPISTPLPPPALSTHLPRRPISLAPPPPPPPPPPPLSTTPPPPPLSTPPPLPFSMAPPLEFSIKTEDSSSSAVRLIGTGAALNGTGALSMLGCIATRACDMETTAAVATSSSTILTNATSCDTSSTETSSAKITSADTASPKTTSTDMASLDTISSGKTLTDPASKDTTATNIKPFNTTSTCKTSSASEYNPTAFTNPSITSFAISTPAIAAADPSITSFATSKPATKGLHSLQPINKACLNAAVTPAHSSRAPIGSKPQSKDCIKDSGPQANPRKPAPSAPMHHIYSHFQASLQGTAPTATPRVAHFPASACDQGNAACTGAAHARSGSQAHTNAGAQAPADAAVQASAHAAAQAHAFTGALAHAHTGAQAQPWHAPMRTNQHIPAYHGPNTQGTAAVPPLPTGYAIVYDGAAQIPAAHKLPHTGQQAQLQPQHPEVLDSMGAPQPPVQLAVILGPSVQPSIPANLQQQQHVEQGRAAMPGPAAVLPGGTQSRTSFMVFDTNVFLYHGGLIREFAHWAVVHHWVILTPVVVMRELDGLKHDHNLGRAARDASRIMLELSRNSVLRMQRHSEMQELSLDMFKWHLTPAMRKILQALRREMPRALRGDDGILNCLQYFAARAQVVLCSNDRNLRISAASREQLMAWTPEELHQWLRKKYLEQQDSGPAGCRQAAPDHSSYHNSGLHCW